jgi:hypothetical protein
MLMGGSSRAAKPPYSELSNADDAGDGDGDGDGHGLSERPFTFKRPADADAGADAGADADADLGLVLGYADILGCGDLTGAQLLPGPRRLLSSLTTVGVVFAATLVSFVVTDLGGLNVFNGALSVIMCVAFCPPFFFFRAPTNPP